MAKKNSSRFLWLFEILNFLINRSWFFWLIGRFNKNGWLVGSVFLTYPVNDSYKRAYARESKIKKLEESWEIRLTAFFLQKRKIIIMFSLFVEEENWSKKENKEKLKEVFRHMEEIRLLLRASQKTFGGTLTSRFLKRELLTIDEASKMNAASLIVANSVELVRKEMGMSEKPLIVVIGGVGYVGEKLVHELRFRGYRVYIIDLIGSNNKWPPTGIRKIVINVAKSKTVGYYSKKFEKGDVFINEAYPKPPSDIVEEIKSLGCDCFHVVGVKAMTFPEFPFEYKGGIPCCAAINPISKKDSVVLLKL